MKIIKWIDDSTFRSKYENQVPFRMRGARKVRIYPDGYFAIQFGSDGPPAHFFLEVDMATMTNSKWQGKVKAYIQFRATGLSQKYYGTKNFRVLTVTTSQQRLENLKRATEEVGGSLHFWFTVREHVDIWQPERFLDPVWSVAGQEGKFSLLT